MTRWGYGNKNHTCLRSYNCTADMLWHLTSTTSHHNMSLKVKSEVLATGMKAISQTVRFKSGKECIGSPDMKASSSARKGAHVFSQYVILHTWRAWAKHVTCLTTLVVSWSNQTCLHMLFMAHMKLCTKSLYSVLGLGYPHMVTKVIFFLFLGARKLRHCLWRSGARLTL